MKLENCVFCNIDPRLYLEENQSAFAIWDKHPVSPGHALVITKEHYNDLFEVPLDVIRDVHELILKMKNRIDLDKSPHGYNLGANVGKEAGQTVFHFHFHIIPRYEDDGLWKAKEVVTR